MTAVDSFQLSKATVCQTAAILATGGNHHQLAMSLSQQPPYPLGLHHKWVSPAGHMLAVVSQALRSTNLPQGIQTITDLEDTAARTDSHLRRDSLTRNGPVEGGPRQD
jgi:hypothetical protein